DWSFKTSNIMRTIAIILIIVAIVAVVQVTGGGSPRPCSSVHCSGAGDLKRCGCGCHNCCVKRYDCKGGVCRRFSPFPRGCYCFDC
ncbi:Hypothetical predicted protein, partial [Mytilus galloprovincialis]